MTDGSVAAFKYFDFALPSKLRIRVRGQGTGTVKVSSGEGEIAAVPVAPSEDWTWYEAAMKPISGVQPLRFEYTGSDAVDFERFRIDE